MTLDGIVLDLDDTLYDTTRLLVPHADRRAAAAMRAAGLRLGEDEIVRRIESLRAAGCPSIFAEIARTPGAPPACAVAGEAAWLAFEPPPMTLDDDVARALDDLAAVAPLALLTAGDPPTQRCKVRRLGIAHRFVASRFADFRVPETKTAALRDLLRETGWAPERTVVAGDRPDSDVRAANRCGCRAVLVRREGTESAAIAPASQDDLPWRTIGHVRDLPALLRE